MHCFVNVAFPGHTHVLVEGVMFFNGFGMVYYSVYEGHCGNLLIVTYSGVLFTFSSCSIFSLSHRY